MNTLMLTESIVVAIVLFLTIFALIIRFKEDILRQTVKESQETNEWLETLQNPHLSPEKKKRMMAEWYQSSPYRFKK